MTGRTHDQIAITGAVAASTAFAAAASIDVGEPLPLDATAAMIAGAFAWARGPDYIEGPLRWIVRKATRGKRTIGHRTWTHYLPTGAVVALLVLTAGLLVQPPAMHIAEGGAAGTLIGWWFGHSLADALTGGVSKSGKPNGGCWLWRRRRQWIVPLWARIQVYTITTKRHWLTGKTTTTKEPSRGERAYRYAATGLCALLIAAHVALLGGTLEVPNDGRGLIDQAVERSR